MHLQAVLLIAGKLLWAMVPLATECASLQGKCLEAVCSVGCAALAVATQDASPTVLPLVVLCLWRIVP